MKFDPRRMARLTLCLAGATVLVLLTPWSSDRDPLAPPPAREPAPPNLPPMSATDWRSPQGSLADALRDFAGRETAKPVQALENQTAALFPAPDGAPLANYAPPGGWLKDADAPPDAATLAGPDYSAFAQALALYRAGDFQNGDAAVAAIKSPAAIAAAQWAALRLHPREAGFARISRFLAEHPTWPSGEWLRRRAEEALFGDHHPAQAIRDYFAEKPPATPAGKLALARTLAKDGDFPGAAALVREVWREEDVNETLENAIRKDFAELLTPADHKYRADRLLYAEKHGPALRAAELAGKDALLLARARVAANKDAGDEKLFASVPPALQKDPGLTLARVHTLRQKEKVSEAAALLLAAPRDPKLIIDGDAWWTERRLLARKLLDRGDAASAYAICAQHAARTTNAKVEAEFHAGWIALRFLNDPATAARHFERLAAIAETPVQKSRAAYWLGRTAETLHTREDGARARAFFAEAAVHSTTFYGQMARLKLGAASASPLRPPPVPAVGEARDESVRALELLLAAGEKEAANTLAQDAVKRLESPEQVAALGEVAARRRDARLSLTLGKLAAHRGVPLDDVAFPSYGVPQFSMLPGSASRSIVYAIARQESAFDPKAVSSAGAMGLMQMIASTARRTAYLARVGFDQKRMLEEPAFNAQLGAAHLGILLGEHKGSYLLTFAAYNAGGGRVREWINAYGDPRHADVDPIDWVERIPISETRNYVQRVMENFVVYRAKFGDSDGHAPHVGLAHAEGKAAQ